MSTILIPLPNDDFDPTESGVPWKVLTGNGHSVRFATPDGKQAQADQRMVHGHGLGPWRSILRADPNGRSAYDAMIKSPEFNTPISYSQIQIDDYDGIVLPGGHAPGMKAYLESACLQGIISDAFERNLPVGAICHGVVLAARSCGPDGRSVLFNRRTTALTRSLELTGWAMTMLWLGSYYRTYPQTVQNEVISQLANPSQFESGPMPLFRDSPAKLERGFTLRDGNYLSARWPGDAHRFAVEFAGMFGQQEI